MKFHLKLLMLFIISLGLKSCFYSSKYVASYDIKPTKELDQTENELELIIRKLSINFELTNDDKYNQSDTLAYFGKPYHYFKYWTTKQDSLIKLTMSYNGSFGNRKSPPYKSLLTQVQEKILNDYNVIKINVEETSNEKKQRKN